MQHLDPLFANSVDAAFLLHVGLYLQGQDLDSVFQLNLLNLLTLFQISHATFIPHTALHVNRQPPAEMEHLDPLFASSVHVAVLLHVGLQLAQTQNINSDLGKLVDAPRS